MAETSFVVISMYLIGVIEQNVEWTVIEDAILVGQSDTL